MGAKLKNIQLLYEKYSVILKTIAIISIICNT